MAAITPLSKTIIDDTPSRVAHEVRLQWNTMVTAIAALDSSTATAGDIVTALQTLKKIVTSIQGPAPQQ